ncbi:hypothetical protein EOA25_27395, partial [Mesorhizobium sp. M2A.F.Ca.ET.040.01.1.1]
YRTEPRSVERCCDKFAQRLLLAEAGASITAYGLAANATDVESSIADIGASVLALRRYFSAPST